MGREPWFFHSPKRFQHRKSPKFTATQPARDAKLHGNRFICWISRGISGRRKLISSDKSLSRLGSSHSFRPFLIVFDTHARCQNPSWLDLLAYETLCEAQEHARTLYVWQAHNPCRGHSSNISGSLKLCVLRPAIVSRRVCKKRRKRQKFTRFISHFWDSCTRILGCL